MNSTHTKKIVFTQSQADVLHKVLCNGTFNLSTININKYNPTTLQTNFLKQSVINTVNYNHVNSRASSVHFYNIKLYNEHTLKQKLNLSTYTNNEIIYLYLIIKFNLFYLCNINSKVLDRVIQKLKLFLITYQLEEYI